jgi:hypothetical protein
MDGSCPPSQEIVMTQPSPHQHVPSYEGPPVETFRVQAPAPARRSRAPFIAAGVAVAAAVTVGAALMVARPWQHDSGSPAPSPVAHTSAASRPHSAPVLSGPVLRHDAVEKFLVDLEDATAPVCNAGNDIAAKVGKTFTCIEGAKNWTVRITEVESGGGVRYELLD